MVMERCPIPDRFNDICDLYEYEGRIETWESRNFWSQNSYKFKKNDIVLIKRDKKSFYKNCAIVSFEYIPKNEKGDEQLNLNFQHRRSFRNWITNNPIEYSTSSYARINGEWFNLESGQIVTNNGFHLLVLEAKDKVYKESLEKKNIEKLNNVKNRYNIEERNNLPLDVLD